MTIEQGMMIEDTHMPRAQALSIEPLLNVDLRASRQMIGL